MKLPTKRLKATANKLFRRLRPRDGIDGAAGPQGPGPDFDMVEDACEELVNEWMSNPVNLISITGPPGSPGLKGDKGDKGDQGLPGTNGVNTTSNVLVGTVTLGESSLITLSLGVRKVTVSLSGTVVGGNYLVFPVSATPTGFSIQEAVCATAGQLTVSILVPVLSVLGSYSIPVRVVRIMT